MLRGFCLVMALALAGCGGGGGGDGDGEENEPACEAGRVVECPCGDGVTGTQECKADGSAWGACDCPGPGTNPEVSCRLPFDQDTLLPAQRCTESRDMYRECEDAAVDSGTCSKTDFGTFCCTPVK